jgi:D-inositol-3-phosphate glycosyltransferase
MRISLVSEHASPLAALGGVDAGGQNVHVAALAMGLARRGHAVTVHTRRDAVGLPTRVALAEGVTVHHVDAGPPAEVPKDELLPHLPAFTACLSEAWRQAPPDVVHAHFWMSGMAALRAGRPLGRPVCHTFHALGVVKRRHQGGEDTSPARRITTEQWIAGAADSVIATCSDEVFELLRMGADRRRIAVIPCGVNPEHFHPDGPAFIRGRHPRLVVLSRLVPRKGIAEAVRALADVPEAELVIAGGPDAASLDLDPEVRRLRELARQAGVARRVRFLGRIERRDVPALLRSADVVVSVPWYEPFGIVPIEAAACGVPVVASAVGGMIDTVVDGVTGLLVPPCDPAAVAQAVRSLLEAPLQRRALGAAAARRARERYAWSRVAAATEGIYATALATGLETAEAGA